MVASAAVADYGGKLAWIGMVLTAPEYRGRGLARALMVRALELCGSAVVRLDASDMGQPLYEQLGFVPECAIERWRREPAPVETWGQVEPLDQVPFERDAGIFGADRSALLRELAAYPAWRSGSAYAFSRDGARAAYFGPCAGDRMEDVEALVRRFLADRPGEAAVWDLFPHTPAAELALRLGFRPVRNLTRMVLKPQEPRLPDPRIWAIAGFELG